VRESRNFLATLIVAASLLPACKTNQACRPGSVFLRTSVSGDISTADSLEVTVKRANEADVVLGPFSLISGEQTIEIDFAHYTPMLEVTFDLTYKHAGQIIATGEKKVTLIAGCTTDTVPVSATVMPLPDLAGVDFSGVDFSGVDLTQPPLPDLSGVDFSGVDFAGVDLTPPPAVDLAVSGDAPGAPTNVTATANLGGTISLSWLAPSNPGSSPISGYSIQSTPNGLTTTVATLNYTTPSLMLGTSYTFDVKAFNSFGSGPAGTSNAVVAGDVPAAPMNVNAMTPSGRYVVTWDAAADHGYPVSNYTVVLSPGGASQTVPGNVLTATLTLLTNLTTYTATVTANNSFGPGPGGMSNAAQFNCAAFTYPNIVASDSASVEYGSLMQTLPEPTIYGFRGDNSDLRGWAKFPLGTVKTWAKVTAITLEMKVKSQGGSPAPVLEAWYSASDNWFRNMNSGQGPQPTDISPGMVVSSTFAPGTNGNFQGIGISLGSHNWNADIADGYITLGVRNTSTPPVGGSSWGQYESSDTVGSKPYILLTTCE
jgi:Fibronectin type III domain/Pentapeptide repeats (8 copies)